MISKPFSLDHLSDTQFEEFCYDLLIELGVANISWRKGTGLSTSPSDRGRDIQCQFTVREFDGRTKLETWFVECKHYVQGVPPAKIEAALTWAKAERPHKLLFVISNFLSNPAKDFIENYQRNERPYFEIRVWEKPDLEKLTVDKTKIRRKYDIGGDFPHIELLHSIHIMYSKTLHVNSLDYLFEILDSIDAVRRDKVFALTYDMVINPRYRESEHENQTLRELMIDEVSYDAFKKKCFELTQVILESFLVEAIIEVTLKYAFHMADMTNLDKWVDSHRFFIQDFQDRINEGQNKELYENLIKMSEDKIRTMKDDIRESYDLYEFFCREVVAPLLVETIKIGDFGIKSSKNEHS